MQRDDPRTGPREEIPDWEALARFLAGESPVAEAQAIAAWLDAHPEDASLLHAVDALASAGGAPSAVAATTMAPTANVDTDAALARVQARIAAARGGATRGTVIPRLHHARRGAPSRRWIGWTGAALAAAAGLVLLVRADRSADDAGGRVPGERGADAPSVLATTTGRRDSVRLPDGTQVVLGPGSRLSWRPRAPRGVTLEGLARFTVVHDAAHPFTVRAGGAVIRDVGTIFIVESASPADAAASASTRGGTTDGAHGGVRVAVSEGAVALHAGARRDARTGEPAAVILRAGDRGALAAGGAPVVERGTLAAADTAWAAGRLVYDAEALPRVLADLRRWYGVQVQAADPALLARRITATFDERDPPARVLDVLAIALGARIDRDAASGVAVLRPAPSR